MEEKNINKKIRNGIKLGDINEVKRLIGDNPKFYIRWHHLVRGYMLQQRKDILKLFSIWLIKGEIWMLEIFEAPYGTVLCWVYEDNVHVGFYDLVKDCMTDINKILNVIY